MMVFNFFNSLYYCYYASFVAIRPPSLTSCYLRPVHRVDVGVYSKKKKAFASQRILIKFNLKNYTETKSTKFTPSLNRAVAK